MKDKTLSSRDRYIFVLAAQGGKCSAIAEAHNISVSRVQHIVIRTAEKLKHAIAVNEGRRNARADGIAGIRKNKEYWLGKLNEYYGIRV